SPPAQRPAPSRRSAPHQSPIRPSPHPGHMTDSPTQPLQYIPVAAPRSQPSTRRGRQQDEILSATLAGHLHHALGLAFEHLDEFGNNELVVRTLSTAISERRDPKLLSQLNSLLQRLTAKLHACP